MAQGNYSIVPVGTPGAPHPLFPGQTGVPMPQAGTQPSAQVPQPTMSPFLGGSPATRPMPGATQPIPNGTEQPLVEEPPAPGEIVDEDTMGQAVTAPKKSPLNNFRSTVPGIISALGYGISTGNLADGAKMLNELGAERRQLAAMEKKANATVKWLRSPEVGREDLAQLVEDDPSMAREAIVLAGRKKDEGQQYPASIQEYMFARSQGYEGTYEQWKQDPAGGGSRDTETFAVQPVWLQNKETGERRMMQLGNKGSTREPEVPEGWEPLDPGDIAADRAGGKIKGEIRAKIPSLTTATQITLSQVDEAIAHPGLNDVVGYWQGRLPAMTPRGEAYLARLDQIYGAAFLSARQQLKGAGQVTDYEGRKAEQAYLRARRTTDPAEHIQALREFQEHTRAMFKAALDEADVEGVTPEMDAIINGGGSSGSGRIVEMPDGTTVRIRPKR